MSFKYQFNKTESQHLQKQLKVRTNALPVLKSKESALRAEIRKNKAELDDLSQDLENNIKSYDTQLVIFSELPDLLSIDTVKISSKKIAGAFVPFFEDVSFNISNYSLFSSSSYYPFGIELLKKIATTRIMIIILESRITLLEKERRKTTQKVNLFEKVQIPALEQAILKIKRFLEDTENLERSSQKVIKVRISAEEAFA